LSDIDHKASYAFRDVGFYCIAAAANPCNDTSVSAYVSNESNLEIIPVFRTDEVCFIQKAAQLLATVGLNVVPVTHTIFPT
jgi:hypothetical protein